MHIPYVRKACNSNICLNGSFLFSFVTLLGPVASAFSVTVTTCPHRRQCCRCLRAGSPLTCYCNVDFTRPGSELPILRKRRYARSSQWLKAKGTVAGKVTEGWSSVNCLGSGEPFHIKCYIISTWQIWLKNISRLKNHYKNKFIKSRMFNTNSKNFTMLFST